MHPANIALWKVLLTDLPNRDFLAGEPIMEDTPPNFADARVLEVGSYDVNGTIRPLFAGALSYLGVDWRRGPKVDLVSLAHEIPLGVGPFGVVASASMLEHDPHWAASLDRMVDLLHRMGVLLLSWGGAENLIHECDCAPDGRFHALPAGRVVRHLRGRGMSIYRLHYEDEVHPEPIAGGVGLAATRFPCEPVHVSPLHPADEA